MKQIIDLTNVQTNILRYDDSMQLMSIPRFRGIHMYCHSIMNICDKQTIKMMMGNGGRINVLDADTNY